MKTVLRMLLFVWLLTAAAWPQDNVAGLDRVLGEMDTSARSFRTTEASFVWDQYQKVIDETDTQKGKIYFRRQDKDTQMAADISEPDKKYVLYANAKIQVYQPKIDQVTEYNPGKNRADLESFLVLGFGGSGHELLAAYDVKYLGSETANGTQAAKLELVPEVNAGAQQYCAHPAVDRSGAGSFRPAAVLRTERRLSPRQVFRHSDQPEASGQRF